MTGAAMPAWWWALDEWASRYKRLKLDHDALRAAHDLCTQSRDSYRERVIELETEMGLLSSCSATGSEGGK